MQRRTIAYLTSTGRGCGPIQQQTRRPGARSRLLWLWVSWLPVTPLYRVPTTASTTRLRLYRCRYPKAFEASWRCDETS